MTVGERIKQLREEKKMRVSTLAFEADLSYESIYGYENNKTLPWLPSFCNICKALDISMDEFMKGFEIE